MRKRDKGKPLPNPPLVKGGSLAPLREKFIDKRLFSSLDKGRSGGVAFKLLREYCTLRRARTCRSLLLTLLLILTLITPLQSHAASPKIGGDFSLTDHHGKPYHLKDQRGKVVVMFFGFTHCPSICPDSLAKMAQVLRKLEGRKDQVSVVFVTVDPARDTPEKLALYVPFFSPYLIGLTGSVADIDKVTATYNTRYELVKKSVDDDQYSVDHSADIYVINRQGKLASIVPYGMPVQHIFQVVEGVLDEVVQPSPDEKADKLLDELSAKPTEESATLSLDFNDLQGNKHRLADYKGKPLLINFWATWCPPCRAELPELNRAWAALKEEGVAMLAVNVGENQTAVEAFLKDFPIDFPVLLDENGDSMQQWAIKGMPTTVILNSAGELTYHTTGEREWDDAEVLAQIRALKTDD